MAMRWVGDVDWMACWFGWGNELLVMEGRMRVGWLGAGQQQLLRMIWE